MLDYDNSAFYYFALTLLSIYLIPGTWYALTELFHAFLGSGALGSKARTSTEKAKSDKLKAATTGITRLQKSTFLINLAVLVVAWLLFLYLISLVISDGEVNTFDPYVILGIEQGAASGEIKKAYRKLSLKYHPDKNIGSKVAEEMFMKIAKAYEALTDETSKENYEKYGNPDGKQSLEVSIGLPRIILDNPKVVLVLYLVAMVVVIPVSVGLWYSNSKQFGEKNIKYDTYATFYKLLKSSTSVKQLPEIMAAAAECTTINQFNEKAELRKKNEEESQVLKNLLTIMRKEKLMEKPTLEQHFPIMRGNLMLHVHMMRFADQLTEVIIASAPTQKNAHRPRHLHLLPYLFLSLYSHAHSHETYSRAEPPQRPRPNACACTRADRRHDRDLPPAPLARYDDSCHQVFAVHHSSSTREG